MSITNLVPILLIFIFLTIIFLIDYYKNLYFNNVKINKKIDLEKVNPTIALYCYNTGTIKNLFNMTLLNLIKKNYFELSRKKNTTYISSNQKTGKLYEHEQIIKDYIEEILDNKKLSLSDFNEKLTLDYKYLAKTNKFYTVLKKEANQEYGKLDFITNYIYTFFVGILYFMQIAFFVYNDFSFSQILLISIPLSFINILLCNKVKDNILNFDKKKNLYFVILSIIASVISCLIWIKFNSSNYILFHVIAGLISFMYPLFVLLNLYFIKTSHFCFNKKQKKLKLFLDNLKKDIIENDTFKEDYYIYTKIFKVKYKFKNLEINDYFENIF